MKPGIISYIPKNALIAAKGLIRNQTITTTAPATIPLIAPARVKSFQYKVSTKGLKAAQKPAKHYQLNLILYRLDAKQS